MRRLQLLFLAGFCAPFISAQSVTLTNIPALDSYGHVVQGGSLFVTWRPFQDNAGALVPGGSKTAIIQNGVFSITLTASDDAGWVYNALIMGASEPAVYSWKIPAAGGVTSISQISAADANKTPAVFSTGSSSTVASVVGTPGPGNCAGSWDWPAIWFIQHSVPNRRRSRHGHRWPVCILRCKWYRTDRSLLSSCGHSRAELSVAARLHAAERRKQSQRFDQRFRSADSAGARQHGNDSSRHNGAIRRLLGQWNCHWGALFGCG